jgi:hypothetical protein
MSQLADSGVTFHELNWRVSFVKSRPAKETRPSQVRTGQNPAVSETMREGTLDLADGVADFRGGCVDSQFS